MENILSEYDKSVAYREKTFPQILFTADTLHDLSHEQRAWGKESRDKAFLMGVKVAERL